jgi:hypothetical protein
VYFAERFAERLVGMDNVEISIEHTAQPHRRQ